MECSSFLWRAVRCAIIFVGEGGEDVGVFCVLRFFKLLLSFIIVYK